MSKSKGDHVEKAKAGGDEADSELRAVLVKKLGQRKGNWAADRVSSAADAFDEDRHFEALSLLKPVMDTSARECAEIRELFGLIRYRLGHWRSAVRELEAFEAQTKTFEQHPVLADCHRAMQHWRKVDDLWREMCGVPLPDGLLTEGRIVAAGALADQGRLAEAASLLKDGWKPPKHPEEHHLRRAYVLADLYEQAGNFVAARRLFVWIEECSPGFVDAAQRAEVVDG